MMGIDERNIILIEPYVILFLSLIEKAKAGNDPGMEESFVRDFFYYFHQTKGAMLEAIDQGIHNAREQNQL